MRVNLKKKIVIIVTILAMILPQLATISSAVDWSTTAGEKVWLGVSFEQENGKYYKVNGSRPVYRTYVTESATGTEKDFTKNLFCLDINGLFPTEVSTDENPTNGETAQYTSQGEITENTTITLSSNTNKTLSKVEVQKILAIMHAGYKYTNFQSDTYFQNWLQLRINEYDNSDDPPLAADVIAAGFDETDVFIAQQVAIWNIANGIAINQIQETTTPYETATWNSKSTANGINLLDIQAVIVSYFRDTVAGGTDPDDADYENYKNYLPSASQQPSFTSKGSAKTTTRINGYVYIGPFQVTNSTSVKEYKVYGVTNQTNGDGETEEVETEITNYEVFNGNEYSSTSYGTIKSAADRQFYIRIPNTQATAIEKIRIKLSSSVQKITLWTNEAKAEAQPLISLGDENISDSDDTTVEKPKYDVALRKYITAINGVELSDENSRKPVVTTQNNSSAFNGNDFKYSHIKEPIKVKVGDVITYEFQVYNECENKVKITGIKDYLPDGLELVSGDWTEVTETEDGSRYIFKNTNRTLDNVKVTAEGKSTTSVTETVQCKVTANVRTNEILLNAAEVIGLTDENGNVVTDEDSTIDNLSNTTRKCPEEYKGNSGTSNLNTSDHYYYGEEDDDDFEEVIVEIEGAYNLKLIKTDASGKTITSSEAEFTINNETTARTTENGELLVAENVEITDLSTTDNYVIEETKAPSGYNKYSGKINVAVSKEQKDGSHTVKDVTLTDESGNAISTDSVEYSVADNLITITVKNQLIEGRYNVNLEKVDESGNTITSSEASFKINGGTAQTTSDGKLAVAQNVEIKDLTTNDDYTIVEENAPNGYTKFDGQIKVSVAKEESDGEYRVKSVTVTETNSDGTVVVGTVTVNNGESAKSTENATVSLENGIITIKVENIPVVEQKEIDLALRKYIATINGTSVDPTRNPNESSNSIDTDGLGDTVDTATYNHPKNVVDVNVGDVIVYTVKVYNEGETDAYATQVTDYIPEGLGYLMFHDINVQNGWEISDIDNTAVIKYTELPQSLLNKIGNKLTASDFRTSADSTAIETSMENVHIALGKVNVKTSKLKDEKIAKYNPDADLAADELSYKTLQVACVVLNPEAYEEANLTTSLSDGKVLKNIASITGYADEDGNTVTEDRDSKPDTINPDNYPDSDNLEDDDDYDPVRYNDKVFDLALKKFITTVKTPMEDGTFSEVDYSTTRMKSANGETLKNSLDAEYDMDKTTVKVKTGDTVIYTIRVYNEGEVDGYASQIADTLPEGLEFVKYSSDNDGNYVSGSKINHKYQWKILVKADTEGWTSGVTTNYLEGKTIPAYNSTTGKLSYEEVQIELKVTATAPEEIKNIAEILKDNGEDRDSTPDNLDETEDDQDYDVIIPQEFDLALQKFITEVDGETITDRKPTLTMNGEDIKYTHTTDPYIVVNGNKITYTIRIYNESDIAGYPTIVKDDLPEGITFLPESTLNKKYNWKMYRAVTEDEDKTDLEIVTFDEKEYVEVTDSKDAEIIATDYYSYENATARGEKPIAAFNKTVGLTDTNPDYRDLQVQFEVTETNVTGASRVIINTAEIAEDEDDLGNPIKDKDSTPDNDNEDEDDIDKEYIQLKYFDLSLLKYVSQVEVTEDGETKVTETGYDGTENPEPIVKVEVHRKKIKTTKIKYTYVIKITNEGEIEGYASEITDYIPEGLEFYEEDNEEYNWKADEDGKVTTDYLKDKLLKPGESANIEIVLRWKNSSNNLGQKINTAEISLDDNEFNAPDIDSTPDNKKDGEDDIDDASVILSIKTGGTQLYIILTLTIISILSVGGLLIYKYVYRPQEATILVDNNKYRHRRK